MRGEFIGRRHPKDGTFGPAIIENVCLRKGMLYILRRKCTCTCTTKA